MTSFERAEEQEIEDALERQAEPMHFPHGLVLRDPPELGWEYAPDPVPPRDIAPNIRHINRSRRGIQWLGPAIETPRYLL